MYSVGALPILPIEYPLVLGDAVHDLRSALDHLGRAIVLHECLSPRDGSRGTVFPVRTKRIHDALLRPTPSPEALAILDMLQPYHDRHPDRNLLAILTKLDNADKHRQLLIAVVHNHGAGWFGPMEPVRWSPLQANGELARFRVDPREPGVVTDPTFYFSICFKEGAVPTVWQSRAAHDCVIEIRDHIAGTVFPTVHALSS